MAAGRIVLSQYFPARDRNARLVSGALLYVYTNGTTTKASIYSDEALTTALANPVEANSSGQFPAIWASDAITYTLSITDADGGSIGNPSVFDDYSVSVDADTASVALAEAAAATAEASEAAIAALLEATGTVQTGPSVTFLQSGTGAVASDIQTKAREVVSVADFLPAGFVASTDDATPYFDAAIDSLGAHGGDVLVPGVGDYRVNLTINNSNIRLVGRGGVGELSASSVGSGSRFPCLRPYSTGAGTYVVRIADGTANVRRIKLDRITICGDDGAGNQAEYTLLLCGGAINVQIDADLSEGQKTFVIDPKATVIDTSPGLPVYGVELNAQIRNDVLADTASRAIYIRKYADVEGYVTAINIRTKLNRTSAATGYWCELNGLGSTGLAVHMNGYVDHAAGWGMQMHGSEVLVCSDLQIDPGASGTAVLRREDNTKDISRFIQGFVEGWGGQLIEFLDGTTWTLPNEPGPVMYEPRIRRAFMGSETYWTADDAAPYATTILTDFTGVGGYMRWNGIKHRWTDTTDATALGTAAVDIQGGVSIAKSLRVGGTWYHYSGTAINMTAEPNGAGWRWDVTNAGGSMRFTPGPGGVSIFGADGIQPLADNAQTLGVTGNAWSNVVATKYSDAAGVKLLGAQGAAVADLTVTATSGTLPTPDGSVTIANAATPTVVELLEFCVELESKLETALARLRAHGLIAT